MKSQSITDQDTTSNVKAFTSYPDNEVKGFGKKRKGRQKKTKLNLTDYSEQTPLLPYDFDSEIYLEINSDVADAGIEAAVHYVYQGIAEGRAYQWPADITPEEKAEFKAKRPY